jgi:hypothetical protein
MSLPSRRHDFEKLFSPERSFNGQKKLARTHTDHLFVEQKCHNGQKERGKNHVSVTNDFFYHPRAATAAKRNPNTPL